MKRSDRGFSFLDDYIQRNTFNTPGHLSSVSGETDVVTIRWREEVVEG